MVARMCLPLYAKAHATMCESRGYRLVRSTFGLRFPANAYSTLSPGLRQSIKVVDSRPSAFDLPRLRPCICPRTTANRSGTLAESALDDYCADDAAYDQAAYG
jgi:hypothetical protein